VFHGLPRLPRVGEELRTQAFTRTFGGGTLITAVSAARSGAHVEVVSALADEAVSLLEAEGARVRNLRRPGEPHARSVALSTSDDRAFVTFDGVNARLESRLLAAFDARLPRTRHLHLALGPRDLRAWTRVAERCRARGIRTSWDFGWHESLPARRGFVSLLRALDWVFVNEQEAMLYAGAATWSRACDRWRTLARHAVIKRGAWGAVALVDGATLRAAAPRVRVVDTSGAGDAFNGAFLAALVTGRAVGACLEAGVRMGSLSTRAAGGIAGLPPRRGPARPPRRPR
jgi:sugar/nucleoside kinase (ribokinase family)